MKMCPKLGSAIRPAVALAALFLFQTVVIAEENAKPQFWDKIAACPSTTVPAAITDDYWHGEFQRVNREVAAAKGTELVFFGDSITWSWSLGPATGKKVWEETYGNYKPINMGNSGDITPVMLHRLAHDNLAFPVGEEPKVAVLLCGTNNFTVMQSDGGKVRWELGPTCPPEDVAAGMRSIAQAFRRALPKTHVILMGILPVKQPEKRKRCEEVNAILASYTYPRDEVLFLDLGKHFLLPDGSQDPKLFTDGTHLTEEGYRVWAKNLAPVLDEMMKAPALKP